MTTECVEFSFGQRLSYHCVEPATAKKPSVSHKINPVSLVFCKKTCFLGRLDSLNDFRFGIPGKDRFYAALRWDGRWRQAGWGANHPGSTAPHGPERATSHRPERQRQRATENYARHGKRQWGKSPTIAIFLKSRSSASRFPKIIRLTIELRAFFFTTRLSYWIYLIMSLENVFYVVFCTHIGIFLLHHSLVRSAIIVTRMIFFSSTN